MKKEIIILIIGVTILSSAVSAVVSVAISGHHKRPPFEQNIAPQHFGGEHQQRFENQNYE